MPSTDYERGYADGYQAVMSEAPTHLPGYHAEPGAYFVGWDAGAKQARSDYWDEKREQSWNDWQAGL